MAIRDKIIAHVESVMTGDDAPDEFELYMIRLQTMVDKAAATDLEFIETLSTSYYGRLTIIQTYNPKWFSESVYSQSVLNNLIDNIILALGSGDDKSVTIPKFLLDAQQGRNDAIMPEQELKNQASRALTVLDASQRPDDVPPVLEPTAQAA